MTYGMGIVMVTSYRSKGTFFSNSTGTVIFFPLADGHTLTITHSISSNYDMKIEED